MVNIRDNQKFYKYHNNTNRTKIYSQNKEVDFKRYLYLWLMHVQPHLKPNCASNIAGLFLELRG